MQVNRQENIVKDVGMLLVILFCAAYSVFSRSFARIHIKLFFLDFPIFVGEILFCMCLFLFFAASFKHMVKNKPVFIGGIFYIVFVLAKVFYGYMNFGPLAFRNAALFYYPLFALFVSSFYRREFFNNLLLWLIAVFMTVSLTVRYFNSYYYFHYTYMVIVVIILIKSKSNLLRYGSGLLLLLFAPYLNFFVTSRANLIASFSALTVIFVWGIKKISKYVKIVVITVFVAVLVYAMVTFMSKDEVKSIVDIKGISMAWIKINDYIEENNNDFKFSDIEVKLYGYDQKQDLANVNAVVCSDVVDMVKKINVPRTADDSSKIVEEIKTNVDIVVHSDVVDMVKKINVPRIADDSSKIVEEIKTAEQPEAIMNNGEVNNIIWRFLVWRDMLVEMIRENPVVGMPFGRPFRSASIESLGWNRLEIEKVGWIEPHNSYVHIIYRFGLLGVLSIAVLVFSFLMLVIDFIKVKSIAGIMLASVLIYWLVIANFMVLLELPFFAIPFWSLFGLALAYRREKFFSC